MSVVVIGAKLGSYLPLLLMTVALLIGVSLAYRYLRDFREDHDPLRDSDLLADLVQGDAASKMTEAEFRRVRDLLTRAEMGRNTRTCAKPPRPKPKGGTAALNPDQSHPSEHPDRTDLTRENPPDTEGKAEG